MGVLLVFPRYTPVGPAGQLLMPTHPPLGIAYLSAFLKAHGVEVGMIDLNFSSTAELGKLIDAHHAQIVGFSVNTFTFPACLDLARTIKDVFPHLRIVFGGLAAPYLVDRLGDGVIDYLVLGEGETPLLELVQHVQSGTPALADIANIAYLDDGKLVQTPRAAPPVAIDELPFPDRDTLDVRTYTTTIRQCYLMASRGCPFSCAFCLSGQVKDKVRLRSVENVVAEIRDVKTRFPFLNRLRFGDETFNLGYARTVELCEAVSREGIRWFGNIRPNEDVDEALLTTIKNSGAAMLEVGGESGNQEILDRIERRTRLDRLETMLECTTRFELRSW